MLVMKEHTIIDGEVGYAFLLEYLPLIRKNYRTFNTIIWRFEEIGESTALSVVLSGFNLQRKHGQIIMIVYQEVYLTLLLVVIIVQFETVSFKLLGNRRLIQSYILRILSLCSSSYCEASIR